MRQTMASINSEGDGTEDNTSLPASMRLLHAEHESKSSPFQPSVSERGTARSSYSERVWSTCVSTLVASIPALLIGYTIAFPSSAVLVLMKDYQFSTQLLDVFGVSALYLAVCGCQHT